MNKIFMKSLTDIFNTLLTRANRVMNRAMTLGRKRVEIITMRVLKALTSVAFQFRKIDLFISSIAASLVGIIVVVLLCIPKNQHLLAQIRNVNSFFLAIGGLIGMILALALSLSIIPIQNAAANLTQSIFRFYREDRLSKYIFSILSIFCLSSFLMVFANSIGLNKSVLLAVDFLIVALSLDLLRFYHRHIINLLELDKGINNLSNRIKRKISSFQKRISFFAGVKSFFLLKDERKNFSRGKLESFLYSSSSPMIHSFRLLTDELAEIALKAVSRSEISRAQLAIFAMSDIACHYATVRKNNLIIYSEPNLFGVKGSDIVELLTPIYEHYKDISRNAVAFRNETTSLHSIKALSQIAIHLTKLDAPAFGKYSVPLTPLPIGYMGTCIETAQKQGFDDVPLQGAHELLSVAKSAPTDVDITNIYLPVLNELNKIALSFLISNKGVFVNSCTEKMMTIAHQVVYNKHFRSNDIIQNILEKIERLLPLTLSYEKFYGSKLLEEPLTSAYDLSKQMSIGYLVGRTTELNKKDEEKNWISPYYDFIKINENIWRHFYNIGKNSEFGDSFILWHILQTLKHIANIFIDLLTKPMTDNIEFLNELSKCFQWYCSFFWLAFDKKVSINHSNAEEACDICAYIGLHFYRLNRQDVLTFCIDNITSIAKSYKTISDQNKQYNPFDMADLLMFLWHFRLVAEKDDKSDIISLVDEKLMDFGVLKSESQEYEAFENRKGHLQNDLRERLHFSQYDNALGILKELLGSQ